RFAITISFSLNLSSYILFFFNNTPTTEIYTLSLHDALPISRTNVVVDPKNNRIQAVQIICKHLVWRLSLMSLIPAIKTLAYYLQDRKSTRLNSSHVAISYAVFCLKKKKNNKSSGKLIFSIVW